MDYLVAEGFKEAAEKFNLEAGVEMSRLTGTSGQEESTALMDQRIEVRRAIEDGDILRATRLINKYYPELLDENRSLYFKLQQQHLIELIRKQKIPEALEFAQEQLSVDEEHLELVEVERTLALLAFDKPENSPYADLLQTAHRQQLASETNEAILKEQMGETDIAKPTLVTLVKLCYWTQDQLDKKAIRYNKLDSLFNLNSSSPTSSKRVAFSLDQGS